jgi:hypothetical protein
METYPNFKQLALSKDGASHCLYFLNAAYTDPDFTSAEDAEDPMCESVLRFYSYDGTTIT